MEAGVEQDPTQVNTKCRFYIQVELGKKSAYILHLLGSLDSCLKFFSMFLRKEIAEAGARYVQVLIRAILLNRFMKLVPRKF